jgi:hypothetical protein
MDTQPPIQDISAIVSRFQAWTGAQAPAKTKLGVREISYEEAVRSSRRSSVEAFAEEQVAEPPAEKEPAKSTSRPASHHIEQEKSPVTPAQTLAFRQVLEDQVIPPAPLTVELSICVSATEQALFKRRAAEANLPVSDYLRKCALEVEELRMQVNDPAPIPQIHPYSLLEAIVRFAHRVLRGKASTLTVRA